jgi:hypothetical protein
LVPKIQTSTRENKGEIRDMKTIAKLMALALLVGSLAFAQDKKGDDTKKTDAKATHHMKKKGHKAKKAKKSSKKANKDAAAASDKK